MSTEAPVPGEMTLLEHLDELRTRLVKVALAVVVGTTIGYALFPQLLDLLIEPYCAVVEQLSQTRE